MVVDVLPTRLVAHCRCRPLLGEVAHRVEEAVTSPADQVDISGEQGATQQVIDRLRLVVSRNGAGRLTIKGSDKHRQSGESLPVASVK